LGLAGDIVWRPAATGAYYARKPFRLAAPLDLLRFTPLPFWDRFRLGWLALHARTIKDWRRLDDISAKDYICRVSGAQVYRVVWEPLFHGKFGAQADTISAAWLWSKLVDRGGSRDRQGRDVLGYLRGGLGRLFDALVQWLQQAGQTVHLGTSVQRLEGTKERISALTTDAGTFPTDAVIGCAQTPDLARLLPEAATSYRQALGQIDFLANVCLVLTLKRSLSDFYWTNMTDARAPFVGVIEQTNWAAPQDYNRKHVVYISAYVPQDDPRRKLTAAKLVDAYLPTLQAMFPTFSADLIEAQTVWQTPYAQPLVQVGYRQRIPELSSPLTNFFVCTMAQIYPHDRQISNGVAHAQRAAEHVTQYCLKVN
jgi:protoporphyrinogen oxidase